MTAIELKRLETILGKVEALQNMTNDGNAKSRLGAAKDELLRLFNEVGRQPKGEGE
jgi:DNA-binding FrmR family transcriptional regulator